MASTTFFKKNAKGKDVYRTVVSMGRDSNDKLFRRSRNFEATSLKAAKKKGEQLEFEWKHENKPTNTKNCTFNELIETWRELDSPDLERKTRDQYENIIKHFLIPQFGVWKLKDIKAIDIDKYLLSLREDGVRVDGKPGAYSEKTILSHRLLLNRLLNEAVRWEMVTDNVCMKAKKIKKSKYVHQFFSPDEIKQLFIKLKEAGEELEISLKGRNPNHRGKSEQEKRELMEVRRYEYKLHKLYVYIALATTSRRGEICGLEWKDIDFENNKITFQRQGLYSHTCGIYTKDTLKNGDDSKTVYIPKVIKDLILDYKEEQEKYREIMGDKWIHTDRLFTSEEGGEINPNNITRWFDTFLKAKGLKKIKLHELRHTTITYMMMNGVPAKIVSLYAGHMVATSDLDVGSYMTTEIYANIYEEKKKEAANIIGRMFYSSPNERTKRVYRLKKVRAV